MVEHLRKLLVEGLRRPGATEFGLVSGRLPSVNFGGKFEAVAKASVKSDDILALLLVLGGSRHIENLGAKPVQWRTRIEGFGQVHITAADREGVIQVRVVAMLEAAPAAAKPAAAAPPAALVPSAADSSMNLPVVDASAAHLAVAAATSADAAAAPASAQAESDDGPTLMRAPEGAMTVADTTLPHGARSPLVANAPVPQLARATPAPIAAAIELDMPTAAAGDFGAAKPAAVAAELEPDDPHAAPERTLLGVVPAAALGRPQSALQRLTRVVETARALDASDVHLVTGLAVAIRAGQDLRKQGEHFSAADLEEITSALLPAGRAGRLEAEGAVDFAFADAALGRLRCNISRERKGPKICLRLVPSGVPTLAELGISPAVASALDHHQGLVLITGPGGHGKSTTLAALVDELNRTRPAHVITVEDPIEFLHVPNMARLTQREVGTHTQSFQHALKASLRQDPDVIAVGELRDAETAKMALAASETGHLVIATMNAKSAGKALERLIDMFPPAEQSQARMALGSSLRFVVGQRLLPAAASNRRVIATELLPASVSLFTMIRDGKLFQLASLMQRGRATGIVRMEDAVAELLKKALITRQAALQLMDAAELESALKGLP